MHLLLSISVERTYQNAISVPESLTKSLPVMIGYFPVAFAFGVSAADVGLPVLTTLGFSVFMYAGSSQFLAVALISQQASFLAILVATTLLNSRHLLMSTAIARYVANWPLGRKLLFGSQMTDETFAIHISDFSQGDVQAERAFAINMFAYASWVSGSLVGYWAKSLIPNADAIGLGFALVGMFIAILTPLLKSMETICVAMLSVGFFFLLQATPLRDSAILVAPLAAALLIGWADTCLNWK